MSRVRRSSRPSSSFEGFGSVDRQPPRSQSSFGFTGRKRIDDPLSHTGFDVLSYFRKHGSAAELTVGVNGRPSNDAGLQNYVQDCRAEALLCELEYEEDLLQARNSTGLRSMRAPLCWIHNTCTEARKQHSVFKVQHGNKKGSKTSIARPTTLVAQQENSHSLVQTLQNTPHMISYGKECILDWSTTHMLLDIHIPSCKVRDSEVKIKGPETYSKKILHCVPELLSVLFNGETATPAPDQLLCVWFQLEHKQCLEKVEERQCVTLTCIQCVLILL